MNNRFLRLLQLYLGAIDFVVINVVFFLCVFFFKQQSSIVNEIEYINFIFFLNVGWLFLSVTINIYREKYIMSFEESTKIAFHTYIYFLLFAILYLFFFRLIDISRIFLIVLLVSIPIGLLANRIIYLGLYEYFIKGLLAKNKVVVIGYNDLSKKLVTYLEEEGINKEIIGFCEDYENVNEISNYPILSNIEQSLEICRKHGVTEIYSTIAPEHNPFIYKLIQVADQNCIRFKIIPDFQFFINKKIHINYLHEIPVIMLRKEPLEDLGNRIKKKVFDVVVSSLVIVFILSWLIPIIGLLIWLESKGPIFFAQERTGKDNRSFQCLKFRSMYVNDNANTLQATKNDNRITRIGRFLRRTSLDEFPQFINVIKGQMSIVGPRPHMVKHTDEYSQLIGEYMVRQFLKPGITGWAQVNGLRGQTQTVQQMQKRVEHDIWYMENWSILVDLKIMFMTVFNTIRGDKSAF